MRKSTGIIVYGFLFYVIYYVRVNSIWIFGTNYSREFEQIMFVLAILWLTLIAILMELEEE